MDSELLTTDGESALHRQAADLDTPVVIVTAAAPDGRRSGCLVGFWTREPPLTGPTGANSSPGTKGFGSRESKPPAACCRSVPVDANVRSGYRLARYH